MRKFRINRYGLLDHIFDVEMKVWYGWTLIKRFKADVKFHFDDAFEIKYAQERAQELLEKLEEEVIKARVKDENLRGWISWSERKPEEGTRGIVIVCVGDGFQLVSMGEICIKMIEAMWKNRTQDMYWSYLPKFKIGGNKVGGIAEKVSAFDNYRIFKEPEHKNINWEQRRYELAKSAMQGLLNATSVERFTLRIKPSSIAEASLEYADELIKELKKNNKKN